MTSGSNCWICAIRALSIAASEGHCTTPFFARTCSASLGKGRVSMRRTADHCSMPSRRSRSDSGASALSLGCIVQEMATGSCGCCRLRCTVCMPMLIIRRGGLDVGMPISVRARRSWSVFGMAIDAAVIRSSTRQKESRAGSSRQEPGCKRTQEGPMMRFCVMKRSNKDVCAPKTWVKFSPTMFGGGICPDESSTTFRKGNSPLAYLSSFSKA
mmetsp:Transcript_63958/g.178947  ORF Transcript_63958/g.178947 Transcript_63958/m.178947 type:complete len:213 (+) Transcript_63958:2630-3268(+)